MNEQCKYGCTYSKAINQPTPRLCVNCGKPEKNITINNDAYTAEEAIEILKIPDVRLDNVTLSFDNPNPNGPIVMEGFELPPGYFLNLAQKMDKCNASEAKVTMQNCRKLGGKDIVIIIKNREDT